MNHRVNSLLHIVSSCYWMLCTILVFLLGPYPVGSQANFREWLLIGVGLSGLDLFAGIRQWRNAATGRTLSITLHSLVTIGIVSVMTFEFLQAQPTSFISWLGADNYWVLSTLGLCRFLMSTTLLMAEKDTFK